MVHRKRLQSNKRKRLSELKAKVTYGYYLIPKKGFPSKEIVNQLPLRKLDLKKFKRRKND
jgi:hypothetical protein